jgi:hypothetical protein
LIQAGDKTLLAEIHTHSDERMESIIVPIYKKGNKTDGCNYHGISLLSTSYIYIYRKIIWDHQSGINLTNKLLTRFFFCQILEKKCEYNESISQS